MTGQGDDLRTTDVERARWRAALTVGAAVVGLTTGVGSTLVFSLGTLIPHLTAALDWTRADISLALMFLTAGIFVAGPLGGRLSDRFGAAAIAAASLISYAILVAIMALSVKSIGQLWAFYFVIALVGVGSTPIVVLRPIVSGFTARRGLAIGIALTGSGLAGFWVPIALQSVIGAHGWQAGYYVISVAALLAAPIVWTGFRRAEVTPYFGQTVRDASGLDLTAAIRTSRFWLLMLTGLAMAVGVGGLIVHAVPLLLDFSISAAKAAQIASIAGLSSMVGRVSVGFLLDRFRPGQVAAGVMALSACGAAAFLFAGLAAAPFAIALLGLAAGAEIDLIAFFTARYFGQRAYGAIYGWQYGVFAIGYGSSPFFVGLLRDLEGDYRLALICCMSLMAVAALLLLYLSRATGAGEAFHRQAQA